jgi:co-chaperonin GroES (HSP10)
MNVRPLHDRLIVRRLEKGEQKIGGIIVPDTAKEKPQQGTVSVRPWFVRSDECNPPASGNAPTGPSVGG